MAETDRELLEKAAKAAGIRHDKSTTNGGGQGDDGFDMLGNLVVDWHNGKTWNPITSHADRYRLARDLKLMIDFDTGEVFLPPKRGNDSFWRFDVGDDKSEAYAIVRAAAAMGPTVDKGEG